MSRSKYQRPTVKLWVGKGGEKFWKADWYVYIEGRQKPKHRAKTWPCRLFTKSKAQQECDRIVREETGGIPKPDGSMTVQEFWERIHWPVIAGTIAPNTRKNYQSEWRTHIAGTLGKQQLQHVVKASIAAVVNQMAAAGKSRNLVQGVLSLIKTVFAEALGECYIAKDPARGVAMPTCVRGKETRPLTEEEVRRLFATTEGRDRLWWRILILTGARISEVMALGKSDLIPAGLRIDESAYAGKGAPTKNRKIRYAPLPDSLRREIEEWGKTVDGEDLFPNSLGTMFRRTSGTLQKVQAHARAVAQIPDLTFRMCRTTFATLFEGDLRDVQEILGHATLNLTVGTYGKSIAARQKTAVEQMETRLSKKVVTIRRKETA
jgi:integrase